MKPGLREFRIDVCNRVIRLAQAAAKGSRMTASSRLRFVFGISGWLFATSVMFGMFGSPGNAYAANILMVVGNANGTVTPDTLGPGDLFIRNRMRDTLGHTVTVRHDTASGTALRTAALASDLVLIVESVTSTSLTNKLKSTPKPVLTYEGFIQDDMGFTATGAGCDPGPPSPSCPFGAAENRDRILIRDSSHPLAAGFTDTVTVYTVSNLELTWGKVAPSAHVVATLHDDTSGAVIYVYDAGDTLFDGTVSAGLRIGYFLEDDNVTGSPNFMTTHGKILFDAAVAYGLGGTVSIFGGENSAGPHAVRHPGAPTSATLSGSASPGFIQADKMRDLRGKKLP
jgi:hypothetical protein